MADSCVCEHRHDEENIHIDDGDEVNHLFQGRETLHLCPGENWLRLVVSTGGLDLLADTQDTTTARVNVPNPSIVSLEEVGKVMEEWPTSDCFICVDVDGSVMTVKDMRPPLLEDSDADGDDQLFVVCLQKRLVVKRLVDTDTVDIQDNDPYDDAYDDAYDELEELPRRQIKLLHNGDRLCTVAAKQRSNIAQNTTRLGVGDERVMAGTLGLVLTYRCYKGTHNRHDAQNNNTQVSQLTALSTLMSGPAATLTRAASLIALETQDSHPLQLDDIDDEDTTTKNSSAAAPQFIATSFSRPGTQDRSQVEVINVDGDADADENNIDNYGGEETQHDDDDDDDDSDEDEDGDPTQAYPLMTQSPERNDCGGSGDADAKPQTENGESDKKEIQPLHAIDEAMEVEDDDATQIYDEKEQISLLEEKTPSPEEAAAPVHDTAQLYDTDDASKKPDSKMEERKKDSPLSGDKPAENHTSESDGIISEKADAKKQAPFDVAIINVESKNDQTVISTLLEKNRKANQEYLAVDTAQVAPVEPEEQLEREEGQVDNTGKNSEGGKEEDAPSKILPTNEKRTSSPSDPREDSHTIDEEDFAANDDDDETVLDEEDAFIGSSLNNSMLDEPTQPLPDSCIDDATTPLVDKVPNGEPELPDDYGVDEAISKENIKEATMSKDPPPSTAVAQDDGSESTALTEVDENIQTGQDALIARVDPLASRVNDEDAIEDPENTNLLSPFSPMARLAPRGRSLHQQMEDSVTSKDEASSDQSKPAVDPEGDRGPSGKVSNNEQALPGVAPVVAPVATPEKHNDNMLPASATKDRQEENEQEILPSRQSARKRRTSGTSPVEQSASHIRRSSPRSNEKVAGRNSQGESQTSIASRKRQKKGLQSIRVVVTGVVLTAKERAKIKAIGGEILDKVEDAASATHVIVTDGKERLRRTPKLMIALCSTSNVISMKWLEDSAKKRKALATRGHLVLHDKEAEKMYKFSMRETLRNGDQLRKQGKTLLEGRHVYVCKGVAGNKAPKENELKLIVTAAGGRWISSLSELKGVTSETAIIITSDPPTKSQLSNKEVVKALKNGVRSVTTSWLFNGLLCQELKV